MVLERLFPVNDRSAIQVKPTQQTRLGPRLGFQEPYHDVSKSFASRHTKKKNLNSSEDSKVYFCTPELTKICNPHSSPFKRMFWMLAVLSCGAICVYQFQDSVRLYLSNPVTTDITFTRRQTLDFPAITVCPSKDPQLSYRSTFLRNISRPFGKLNGPNRHASLQRYENLTVTFENVGTTLQKIWNEFAVQSAGINVSIPVRTLIYVIDIETEIESIKACIALTGEVDDCYDEMAPYEMKMESMQTFLGNCTILTPISPVEYQGPNTYLYFRVEVPSGNRTYNNFFTDVQIFVHIPKLTLRHDAVFMAEYIYRDYKTNLRFAISEFTFLNRSEKYCSTAESNNRCRNDCIEKKLETKIKCKLPFMSHSKIRECKTIGEAVVAYNLAHQIYINMKNDECRCNQNCDDFVYHVSVDVEGPTNGNRTEFMLYYADNLVEQFKETYAYGFSAVISDIGGSLGFFLGVCCLSCIEIVEKICAKIFSALCKCRRNPRHPTSGPHESTATLHSYFYEKP